MTTPKLLALDIDGTTLTENRQLRRVDQLAVRALQEQGVHVALATGRLYSGTTLLAHRLGIELPVACMNGAERVDPLSGVRSHQSALPAGLLPELREILVNVDADALLFGSSALHLCDRSAPMMHFLENWSETFTWYGDIYDESAWSGADPLLAVAAQCPWSELDRVKGSLSSWLPDGVDIEVIPRTDNSCVLLIRDGRYTKGTALEALGGELGIEPAEMVSVGDWLNDLPMFQTTGRSFAMGQAIDAVKDAATDTLDATSAEGGAVAEVAKKVWGVELPESAWLDERRFSR